MREGNQGVTGAPVMVPPVVCESCGAPAEVRLADGSHWCLSCDIAARELGYDNAEAVLL